MEDKHYAIAQRSYHYLIEAYENGILTKDDIQHVTHTLAKMTALYFVDTSVDTVYDSHSRLIESIVATINDYTLHHNLTLNELHLLLEGMMQQMLLSHGKVGNRNEKYKD